MRFLLVFLALSISGASLAAPQGVPARGKILAEKICMACHSIDGNSVIATNPSLAGQHPEYLYKQLNEFKQGKRKNPTMSAIVTPLKDDDLRDAAAWFSSQTAKERSASDKARVESGQNIYRAGIPAKGIPACMGCHSPNGAGIPALYPRIGGQHAGYIVAQLNAFRAEERTNAPIMQSIADKMTDKEIKAVAEYVQALH